MTAPRPDNEAIFHAAHDISDPGRRREYVQEACAGDNTRIAYVEALLAAADAPDSLLDRPAGSDPAATLDLPNTESPGTVIGPYKLLEQIGEGGMGTVWMAQQTEPVKRLVAVKLIKAGMDSQQFVARFEAERQALALMDHPNIAKVLDGGTTDACRPYFVMDLVKGVPITKYCDEHRFTPRQRLELFIPVCQAVQHAHQKGIIHRDLKPSNVLVALYDGRPLPKVIDFGVAKAAGEPLTEKTLVTGFGAIVGTLEYMSPEQAELNNLDIDTRSDVYSLGVLLYELLTGTTPLEHHRAKEKGILESLRIIREEEPPTLSNRLGTTVERASIAARRGVDPAKLTRLLRGELDWIAMKALEKDRNRRYATANDLALDVQRYLADEPVLACPPSVGYRLRKFARRNKGRLAVAAGLFLAVTASAAAIGWAVGDRVARRATVAVMVRDSLSVAREFITENKLAAAREKLAEARAQLAHDRSSLTNLANEVDATEAELDRFQQFQNLIERAHAAEMAPVLAATVADGFRGGSAAHPPEKTGDRRPGAAVPFLLEALQCYGVLEQSDWDRTLDGGSLGQQQVQQIRRLVYEELLWLADDVARRRQAHAFEEKLSPVAAARQALIYLAKAERAHRPTPAFFALRASSHKASGDEAAAQADTQQAAETPPTMAVDHYLRGQAAYDTKQMAAAVESFEAALNVEPTHYWSMMKLGYCLCDLGRGPDDFIGAARVFTGCILNRPEHAHAYYCRANAYFRLRRYDESLADNTRAIELDPEFAPAWNSRGADYNKLDRPEQAVADFTRAIDLNPKFAVALYNRATTFVKLGRLPEAIADYTRVIDLEPTHAEVWNDRGSAHSLLGELNKALADFTRATELAPKLAPAWHNRGMAHEQLGKPKEAIDDYSKAIELDATFAEAWYHRGVLYGKQNEQVKALADLSKATKLEPKHARAWYNRGAVHHKLGQTDKAVADYNLAIELDPNHAPAWTNRGLAHSKQGQRDKAIADFTEAIKVDSKHVPAYCGRGWDYNLLGQLDKSVADFTKAIELGPNCPQLVSVYRLRAQANSRLGHFEQARTDFQTALKREPDYAWTNSSLAWLLATCPDTKLRDPPRAVELATKATQQAPKVANCWRALGVAHYRAGDWKAAIAALDKSVELGPGGGAVEFFFVAMAHRKLGHHDEARKAYEQALQWVEKNKEALEKDKAQAEEICRFRAEAEEVLDLKKK